MHVDEDLAQGPVLVFAGAQIDLVAADHGFLGIAPAPVHQFLALRADLLDDHLLDDLVGQDGGALSRGGLQQFLLGLLVDQRGRQRLAELGAVAVECVGLHAETPGQKVSLLAFLDGGVVRHVDGLRDGAGDEALRRRHHADMALDREIPLAGPATGIGAVEDRQMLVLQPRGTFQGHGPAGEGVGHLDLAAVEADLAQQVEAGVGMLGLGDAQHVGAEIGAERPPVEHEADVEGGAERGLDLFDLGRAETGLDQPVEIDPGRAGERAVADRVVDDAADGIVVISQRCQSLGHRAVDDLEVAAAGQLLELHQREVGLDAGGVAVHHQADGAGGRDDAGLGVAVAVLLAQLKRTIPRGPGALHEVRVRAVRGVQRHREGRKFLVARGLRVGRPAVVADDPQHVLGIGLIAGEDTQLGGHLGRSGVSDTGQDGAERTAQRPALIRVIAMAEHHQEPADIGVSEAEGAVPVGQLRDPGAGELGHGDRDFQSHRPQPDRMFVGRRVERPVVQESQKVDRGQVAGGVVQEHVFRARVRGPDRPRGRAGVPVVDGVVELHAGVGAGPGGVADLVPELARLDGLGDLAVSAPDQLPVGIGLDRRQEGVGDPDRVVRVLARDGEVGLAVPVGVVGRELDRGETLHCVLEHALDVALRDHRFAGVPDRRLEAAVGLWIEGIGLGAVPGADRGEQGVELLLMQLRSRNQARNLLFFFDFPVDEGLDIGVIHVADHHLRGAARGAAGFNGAGGPVPDLQEAHESG